MTSSGCSGIARVSRLEGNMASAVAQAYSRGLGAVPPAGFRGRAPGRGIRGQSPLKLKAF